jgi:hypothetical protein
MGLKRIGLNSIWRPNIALEITGIASPKNPPKSTPQNELEIPQIKASRKMRSMVLPAAGRDFLRIYQLARVIMMP